MWNIVGHLRTVEMLRRDILAGSLPHALFFTGPAGVGKTRLALELAMALNCDAPETPCRQCVHCRQIESSSHPDVSLLERADGKDSITIQQARELREATSLRPFQGKQKVYIIAGAEALTEQAADALLKTLEEPLGNSTIVLTCSDLSAVPGTIVSRCRVMPLQAIPQAAIAAALEQRGESAESAQRIARLARGSMGWAVKASADPKLARQQEELLARLREILRLDPDGRLQLIEALTNGKKDRSAVRHVLELLALLGRERLLADAEKSSRFPAAGHAALLSGVRLAMERIDQNVDPRLTLEALALSLP